MVTMPCYDYELTVQGNDVLPHGMLDGGTAGDKGALRLTFVTDGTTGFVYRAEAVNGAGGYDITDPLTVTNGKVVLDVPPSWAVAGVTAVRLVQTVVQDGEETVRRYYPPVTVKFAYRDEGNGAAVAAPQWQEMLTRAEHVLETVQASAVDASTAAELAAEYAESAASHAAGVDLKAGEALELAQSAISDASAVREIALTADSKADALQGEMGQIEEALDEILAIQNTLIGGGDV